MKSVGYLALPVVLLGTIATADEETRLRAAPRGRVMPSPDGTGPLEYLVLDSNLATSLLSVPLETSVRVDDWPVAPGVLRPVLLRRHDIYARDARIIAIDHGREVEVPRSRLALFWGAIEGEPGGLVVLSVDPDGGGISGFAAASDLVYDLTPPSSSHPGQHLLAPPGSPRATGEPVRATRCGQSELAPTAERSSLQAPMQPAALPSSLQIAVLAVDTDNEFMRDKFGNNTTNAVNYIAQAIAGTSAVFERDFFVRLNQGYTILRLSSTLDPYEGVYIQELTAYWLQNYSAIARSLTTMFSGKQPPLAYAWVGALCDTSLGYNYNRVTLPGITAGFSEVSMLGHEVGHNFGSWHTHCSDTDPVAAGTQPIDYCYSSESCDTGPWIPDPGVSCPAPLTIDPVNGPPVAGVRGTIMSYCGGIAGCYGLNSNIFHPTTVGIISPYLDAARTGPNACVFPLGGDPGPTITGIVPTSGFHSGGATVTISGSNFGAPAKVTFADLSGARSASSVNVINSNTIVATTPAHTLGPKDVVVAGPDLRTSVLRNGFTYNQGMVVSGINPNGGTTAGGTAIGISGVSFAPPTTVTIGGVAATDVVVTSPATIRAVTGAHPPGIVDVTVQSNGQSSTMTNAYIYSNPMPPADFYSVAPCRLVDTRNPNGPRGGPALVASASRNFALAGVCAIPSTARAISVNITATGSTATGFLRLFPGDGIPPLSSAINFGPGQTRANNAIVALATDGTGSLAVFNGAASSVHLILDVNGYLQ